DGTLISVKNYTKSEGFLGVETDLNGVFEDRYGNIWFGTVNGIIKYNPLAEKKNLVKPAVYIKNIRLFFKDFDKKLYSDSVDDNNMPLNLVLPWNKNHITFDFIGLCYSNPEKVRYKYRLKGQNNEWSPPAADRKAVFTNIAPGKYTFEVTASNDDGLWADTPAVFTFTIEPPIWGRLWFKIGGAVLLFVLILILAEYRNRALKNAKNKLEKTVEERTSELKLQKEQLQKNNIRITDSINYAGKIQKALMPSHKFFRKRFPESFVVYKPKDIVSGDFYWAKEIRRGYDSYTVIVAADSTGHGIPGALVSMLGMSLLNEIVRKEEIKTANSILEELRKELKSSLNQKNDSGDRTEGIDMAVIMINDKTREMQYSGANSPLYVIRNGELILFEPTVNPVGVFLKELPFKNHLFQLMPGDMLYLFSDGFEDQFNGKTGEKFKLKRFRELLLKIYKKSCIRQKQILEKIFEDWKGDCEQIDDVLILGLRI
ncbi:MAG: SpoIIE family protein phosphatase, partial [Chlorobi bacterium]|nr:SpoIIE family protein phosphatase [Chlorobiota bacterium]